MSTAVGIAIVTPVFEDREASTRLFVELRAALGPDVFIVAVDDGSIRQPVQPDAISAAGLRGVVLRLKRNVGHQRAIATGIAYVADHLPDSVCVVMDSDGEDLPSTIPALLARLDDPNIDVAVAQRKSRVETWRFKAFYEVYKFIFTFLTGRTISFGGRVMGDGQPKYVNGPETVLFSKRRTLYGLDLAREAVRRMTRWARSA